MGRASRKKQEQRARRTAPAASAGAMTGDDPRALGDEAIGRLLRANSPERPSLAAAYAAGFGMLWMAQQEGTAPHWHREIDPLDALFLGLLASWPFRDEAEFANARDAWLRLLRGTVHGRGIERFVREAVSASAELGLPVDDPDLMVVLAGRLEAAGLDARRLPRRLLPETSLLACRALYGPSVDLRFPEPPADAEERIERFWRSGEETAWAEDTPQAVLRDGLRRFHDAGQPVERESGVLLPALYAALLANPGEPLEDMGEHAWAWALSLDETSTLVPVLDLLLVAPEREMSVADTLGCLFALPAFTEPIPSDALLWTSSPGLALPRLAFGMGMSEISAGHGAITPDGLGWAGMHARMRISSAARRDEADPDETDGTDETDGAPGEPDEQWAERREAVREAVLRKVRRKGGERVAAHLRSDRPAEQIWNADGSSVTRLSADTGKLVKAQLDAFRKKFGREPGPGDPLLFDLDADEPTPITREDVDRAMLNMAELSAELGIDPAFFQAGREVGYMVTEENQAMFTKAEIIAYDRAVTRYRQAGA